MSPTDPSSDFPHYELLERIATTATVEVYRARHRKTDREVAIKVLRPGFATPQAAERFFLGVRILACIHHPGIPSAFDLSELPDGRPFLAMALIRGPTLSTLLRERATPSSDLLRFLRVFEQASRIAGFAHSEGIVHRDIKPGNVMIGEHGEVQLISWSLAYTPGELTQEVLAQHPNQAGAVMGTPMYMPPEQARGELATERSDVFGLGGILCHILTGGQPFRNSNVIDVIQTAAAGDLTDAFGRLDACGADPRLVSLCKQCLAPDPADRPADGIAVAELVARITS
jgi:serine/threonine protein kinase